MNVQRTIVPPPGDTGYENDFHAWLERQIEALRARDGERIDWDNVAEEMEGLGASDRRELANRIAVVIEHLLKHEHGLNRQPAYKWARTVRDQRAQIALLFAQSPSLRRFVPEFAATMYAMGRTKALDGFEDHEPGRIDLYRNALPPALPYPPDQILDPDFLPEPGDAL